MTADLACDPLPSLVGAAVHIYDGVLDLNGFRLIGIGNSLGVFCSFKGRCVIQGPGVIEGFDAAIGIDERTRMSVYDATIRDVDSGIDDMSAGNLAFAGRPRVVETTCDRSAQVYPPNGTSWGVCLDD